MCCICVFPLVGLWQPFLSLKTNDEFSFFSPNTGSACSLFFHCDGFAGWCRGQQRSHLFQTIGQPGAGEGRWLAFAFLHCFVNFKTENKNRLFSFQPSWAATAPLFPLGFPPATAGCAPVLLHENCASPPERLSFLSTQRAPARQALLTSLLMTLLVMLLAKDEMKSQNLRFLEDEKQNSQRWDLNYQALVWVSV